MDGCMQLLEDLELKIAHEKLEDIELQSTIDAYSAIGKVGCMHMCAHTGSCQARVEAWESEDACDYGHHVIIMTRGARFMAMMFVVAPVCILCAILVTGSGSRLMIAWEQVTSESIHDTYIIRMSCDLL